MPGNLTAVYGVNVKALMYKSDAGNRMTAAVITSSGTTATGSNLALGSSGLLANVIAQTDPATGVAWTQSGVNASHPGYTIVS